MTAERGQAVGRALAWESLSGVLMAAAQAQAWHPSRRPPTASWPASGVLVPHPRTSRRDQARASLYLNTLRHYGYTQYEHLLARPLACRARHLMTATMPSSGSALPSHDVRA